LVLDSGNHFPDSPSPLLDYGAIDTMAGERDPNSYADESGGHEGADISPEAHDARVADVYSDVPLAETVSQTRSHSIAISPSRSVSGRRASSSQKPVSRTRSLPLPEPVDTHGWRMLTGWEFWLLFSILSIRECHPLVAYKVYLLFYAESGTGLMCETSQCIS
jgi:hypothetical protein